MAWKKNRINPDKYKRNQFVLAGVLTAILVLALIAFFIYLSNVNNSATPVTTTEISERVNESEQSDEISQTEFDSAGLQKIVDDWSSSNAGESSIVIADIDGNVIASNNQEVVYFAASIYKLYVAYAGYQQIDNGTVDPEELYLNGNTRAECLDLMIRESDSPCGEKLWTELGKEELTTQLKEYGIKNTSMTGITTTAEDAGLILSMIERGEGLSDASRKAFLDSMKTQDALYRRGLPSGFSDDVIVYNKVGWNELKEWHDTAILEFSDGRKLIVTVFTDSVGISPIVELAKSIEMNVAGL
jgi:hypothetical protein